MPDTGSPSLLGRSVGQYRVVARIGAGGMGEVYRATDTRLNRDVAVKILPSSYALDDERMARFSREARVLASLNHANIATIYGFEESNGLHALAMEFVEGQTLADRIARGPIPIEESLVIARQIAEALEYAHERGIVHRDLKPANVIVSADDKVKLLDFGLAKALETSPVAQDISSSPTMTMAATTVGVILGTAAYMSPEQARGKSVDRRADLWSFGCVFYEILTAKRAFSGDTVSDTLAAIIRSEPDWSQLPANVSPAVRELLRRCLIKDPRGRLQAIGDARVIIEEVLNGEAATPATSASPRALPWAALGLCIVALLAVLALVFSRDDSPPPLIAAQMVPPPGTNFALLGTVGLGPPLLSPDGSKIAFVASTADGTRKLWVRSLQSVTAHALEGTEGASMQFWSPDSQNLGFFAYGKLKRVPATGGSPLELTDAGTSLNRGATWGANDIILVTPTSSSPILQIHASASRGALQPVTQLNAARKESSHRWAQFLPDGKRFLFYSQSAIEENSGTYVASVDGGEPKLVLRGSRIALFAAPGYLLFLQEGVLMAQRFDLRSLQLTGDAVPIVDHVEGPSAPYFHGNFSASDKGGYLLYDPGNGSAPMHLLWYDRSGAQLGELEPADYESPRLSPDGKKLAVTVVDHITSVFDIWIQDLAKGTRTRITFSKGTLNLAPSWSPDGKTIVFESNAGGRQGLFQKAADGTGETTPLLSDTANDRVPRESRNGRYLVFQRTTAPGAPAEIWALPLFGDRKPFAAVQGHTDVSAPDLSPNEKWLAYVSSESGRNEVYVVPFNHSGGKSQISQGGGDLPRWRADGKELFFLSQDNKMTSVEIKESPNGLETGTVRALFQTHAIPIASWSYDVSEDGKRFLVISEDPQQKPAPVTLITNWTALLKQK
ncbi:MAG TPA: protein kinase [Candidatus Acidoferrales bacterium]|nr:protein kinase [Candidatus Acidoferrales bacterium]